MEKDADGNDIVVPKKYDFQFDVKDNAHFTLTGLFNGNTELSEYNFMSFGRFYVAGRHFY